MIETIENFEEEFLESTFKILKELNKNKDIILKARFIQECFEKNNIKDPIIDKKGNVVGNLHLGKKVGKEIIISAGLNFIPRDNYKSELTLKRALAPNISNAVALNGLIYLGKILNNQNLDSNIQLVASAKVDHIENGMKYILANKDTTAIKGYISIKGEGLGEINTQTLSKSKIKITFKSKDNIDSKKDKRIISSITDFYNKLYREYNDEYIDFIVENVNYDKYNYKNKGHITLKIKSKEYNKILTFLNEIKELLIGVAIKYDLNYSLVSLGEIEGTGLEKSYLENIFKLESKKLNLNTLSRYVDSEISEGLLLGIDSVDVGISSVKNKGCIDESVCIKSIYEGMLLVYNSIIKLDKS